MNPREAVIAVTYRCNCRCVMCNIWKEKVQLEMPADAYSKLPTTLRVVNITGGEPFLRPDLGDVVKTINRRLPRSRLVFSTNGLMNDRIISEIGEYASYHKRIGVGISIDGLMETHNRIRGVENAYENALATITGLKETGLSDLRIGMTIMPENVGEIRGVFRLATELGVEFTSTIVHNSEIYFKKTNNSTLGLGESISDPLSELVRVQLKSHRPKEWFRALHTQGIFDTSIRDALLGNCQAGHRYFFMAPNGDIYPCNVMNLRMGNLNEASGWNHLMTPENQDRVCNAVSACKLDCWMVCNTRSLILSHPIKSVAWVLKNKLGDRRSK